MQPLLQHIVIVKITNNLYNVNKLILELSRGQWLISREYAQAYLFQALEALSGNTAVSGKPSLSMAVVSSQGVSTITPDTWEADPRTIFDNIAPESTVVIPIQGAITKYDNCGMYGAQTYSQVIRLASENSNIKSVVLDIDSPGGSADGSYDMAAAVQELARNKPVIAYVNGLAASAAYRVAAQASAVIAKPGSIVGSIGTMVTLTDFTTYLSQRGIREVEVYASDSKDKNKDFSEAVNGNPDLIRESVLDPMNDIFLNEMRESRNLPDEVLTGKVYTDPKSQIDLGLVDMHGSFADALNLANQNLDKMSNSFKDKILNLLGIEQVAPEAVAEPVEVASEVVAEETQHEPQVDVQALIDSALAKQAEQHASEMAELKESIEAIARQVKTSYKAPVASAASEPIKKRTGTKKI